MKVLQLQINQQKQDLEALAKQLAKAKDDLDSEQT
jgi:hypothetical protein